MSWAARVQHSIRVRASGGRCMDSVRGHLIAVVVAAALTACGSDSSTPAPASSEARGALHETPPVRIASADAATLKAQLGANAAGAQLLQLTGPPVCGV